jgi:hypothetical protein
MQVPTAMSIAEWLRADRIGAGAAIVAVLLAVIALIYAAIQVRIGREQREDTRQAAFTQVLLQIDALLVSHRDVHAKLRPKGPWHKSEKRPKSYEEWAETEQYMGVFERIHAAIENRQVELKRVEELYGYRVSNIWANPCIRKKKLEEQKDGWKSFIELTRWLEWQRSMNGNPTVRYPGRENISEELVPPPVLNRSSNSQRTQPR